VGIVIDTNVWVSGLLWQGAPWELLRLAEAGRLTLCTTPGILAELADVLSHERIRPRLDRLGLTPVELVGYAINLAAVFEVTEGDAIVLADPDDDVFLWCARAAEASYAVSGDRHLLDLGTYAGILIVTVRDLLTREFRVDWLVSRTCSAATPGKLRRRTSSGPGCRIGARYPRPMGCPDVSL
jgi:putative PIN family toxin of toxin-antitoxin system